MWWITLFVSLIGVSSVLTTLCRIAAARVRLLDSPSQRSAHTSPTPVGGGLAIVLSFLAGLVYCAFTGLGSHAEIMALSGALPIAIIGLLDDWIDLSLRWRLPVQLAAAAWVLSWLGGVPPIDFGGWLLDSPVVLTGLGVLALVWLLNLYNFMDGIDGLAGGELVFVTALSFLLVISSGTGLLTFLSATLSAAGIGFLVHNWPPARIFMGDVGSGFIGFTLGVLALISMHQGVLSVWTWFILLGVFVVDATLTVVRRVQYGERWYEGHSSHAYQHAARRCNSHAKVTITIMAINGAWLAPLAWLSVRLPEAGPVWCVLALGPLVVLAWRLGAGLSAVRVVAGQT